LKDLKILGSEANEKGWQKDYYRKAEATKLQQKEFK
jgi:hypothetical protein